MSQHTQSNARQDFPSLSPHSESGCNPVPNSSTQLFCHLCEIFQLTFLITSLLAKFYSFKSKTQDCNELDSFGGIAFVLNSELIYTRAKVMKSYWNDSNSIYSILLPSAYF